MINTKNNSDQFVNNSLTGEIIYFTKREYQILSCLLAQESNKVIARIFGCSPRTIEGHVSRIISKFEISSRDEISSRINKLEDFDRVKKQYKSLTGNSFDNSKAGLSESLKNMNSRRGYKYLKAILPTLFVILFFLAVTITYFFNRVGDIELHPGFSIPSKELLLPRNKIINEIEAINFNGDKIPVAALLGVAGSGKTVLARSYAKDSTKKIIWEINA